MRNRSISRALTVASGRGQARSGPNLDIVFSALSDPTRREILDHLSRDEASVTDLAEPFKISLPAVSKHLGILERSGLITRERKGRIHKMHLAPGKLLAALEWMEQYRPLWETQLDSLGVYLERERKRKKSWVRPSGNLP